MSTNYELIADLEREPSFLAKTFRDLPVVPIVILSVIIFAAIFFGGLMVGGRIMQFSPGVPLELVRVIEGVIILALAVPELKRSFRFLRARFGLRRQSHGS